MMDVITYPCWKSKLSHLSEKGHRSQYVHIYADMYRSVLLRITCVWIYFAKGHMDLKEVDVFIYILCTFATSREISYSRVYIVGFSTALRFVLHVIGIYIYILYIYLFVYDLIIFIPRKLLTWRHTSVKASNHHRWIPLQRASTAKCFPLSWRHRDILMVPMLTLPPWQCTNSFRRQTTLCMRPVNERRRYNVTTSLIGWAHT